MGRYSFARGSRGTANELRQKRSLKASMPRSVETLGQVAASSGIALVGVTAHLPLDQVNGAPRLTTIQ